MAVRLTKVDIETSLSNGPSGSSNGTTNKTSRRPSWPNGHYSPDGPIQDLFNNKGTFQSSFCHSKKISSYVNAVQNNSKHQGSQAGHNELLRPGLQRPSSPEDVNKIGIFEKVRQSYQLLTHCVGHCKILKKSKIAASNFFQTKPRREKEQEPGGQHAGFSSKEYFPQNFFRYSHKELKLR